MTRPFGYARCSRCDSDRHSCCCVGRRLARWVAALCRRVANRLELEPVATEYNASASKAPAAIDLAGSVVRAGCLFPPEALIDELTVRDALQRSIRRYSPAFEPGQA
jgi:hypothetical protein